LNRPLTLPRQPPFLLQWYANFVTSKGIPRHLPPARDETTQVDRVPIFEHRPTASAPLDELYDAEETGVTSSNLWMSLTGFARLRQETAARTAWKRALPLRRALQTRIRLLGYSPTLAWLAAVALVVVGALGVGFSLLLGSWIVPAPAVAAPSPPPSDSVKVPPISEPPQLSEAQRAALGDDAAMDTLAHREPQDLSPDELLALLEGRRIQRRQALTEVGERFIASPEALRDEQVAEKLSKELDDPVLRVDVLRSLARVGAPVGPDLLYAIREDRSRDATTQWLAGALLRTLEVRQHLSPALEIALELEDVADCLRAAELVDLAIEQGDRRSLVSITRLTKTTGCDPDGTGDCFPCLRSGTELLEAMEAVGERKPPVLPPVARPLLASTEGTAEASRKGRRQAPTPAGSVATVSSTAASDAAPPAPDPPSSDPSAPDVAARAPSPATQDPGF
jgi:hypothetical protein